MTARETKVRPGVTLRGRGTLPTLALMLALAGCSHVPDHPTSWTEKGHASWSGQLVVWQDAAGCYWLTVDGKMRPLVTDAPTLKDDNHQWCEAARNASPQGNSGRDQ